MNTFIYAAVAALAVALTLRAWLQDRRDPVRRAFVALGLNLCWAYGSFATYLATASTWASLAWATGSALVPATLHDFLAALFPRQERPGRARAWLWRASVAVAVAFPLVQVTFFSDLPRASPAEVILAVWVFGGAAGSLVYLLREHGRTSRRVQRARIRYLLGLLGGAILFSALEAYARAWVYAPESQSLTFFTSPVVLQGAVPPLGVVFTGVFFYFLYQGLVLYRLLDLHEIFSRIIALGISGVVLVALEGVVVLWNGSFTLSPVHATYLAFVSAVVFLAAYDPLRQAVERWTDEQFNRRGRVLALTLQEVDRALPRAIGLEPLFATLLEPLVASGRVPYAAVYLWDEERYRFVRAAARGATPTLFLEEVPPHSLAPGSDPLPRVLVRADLEQHALREDPEAAAAGALARLLKAMGADVLLPLTADDLLLGWLALQDEPWSDGFSHDETTRLRRTADRAAVMLESIHGFERLREQHRLAALGTMAAGLAHEIRNPLAGIRGAAQYLAGSEIPAESAEFLDIIVTEVDRLDAVVTQFLDYARPLEVSADMVELNAVVTHCLHLVRSQGLPPGVVIHEDLGGGLPRPRGDPHRLGQVVLNIVQNGVQAMPDGGTLTVRTRPGPPFSRRPGQATVELVVEDTGQGIPPGAMDKLFIPFFTTRERGTGLGLPICLRIVQAHGGTVEVSSTPGKGSRFSVRLPVPLAQA